MRPYEKPPNAPAAPDVDEIRRCVTELYALEARGEFVHGHPVGVRLVELAGVAAYYRVSDELARPGGPHDIDDVVADIVRLAPRWLSDQRRLSRMPR